MALVKKLRHILEDTLAQLSELEQRYRNVLVRFTCYRNSRLAYESKPMTRSQLPGKLPEACRQERATEVALVVTGTNRQLETTELHRSRFVLAVKEPQRVIYQSHSLDGFEPDNAVMESWGGGGLGAIQTAATMINKIVADELFLDKHEKLQQEAEALRAKVATLETELKEQQAVIDARDIIKERIEQIGPFLPLVAQLLGPGTQAGKAINGLAGITGNPSLTSDNVPQDDEHTTAFIGLVRGFMISLPASHKGQLVSVMQRVRQDPNLITRIAKFIQQPPAVQPGVTALKPEQKQDAAQPQQDDQV